MSEPNIHEVHTQRTAQLLRSTSVGIELIVSGLRSALAESGEVPEDIEAALGQIVRAAAELRDVAPTMEARP